MNKVPPQHAEHTITDAPKELKTNIIYSNNMPTLAATYTFPLGTTIAEREGDWGKGVGGAGGTGAAAPHAPPLRAGGQRSPDDEAVRHRLGMTSSRTTKISQRSGATTRRPGRGGDQGGGGS